MLYHVVAMARNRVIGKNGKLPWHFSSDLKYFKKLTWGGTVLMGRKTFESIGKPLPGRDNLVLTHSQKPREAGVQLFASLEEALRQVKTKDCFIIGGASLYEQTMDKVDGVYLTQIDQDYEGDAYYPRIPPHLKEKRREKLQENPKLEAIFYERTKPVS